MQMMTEIFLTAILGVGLSLPLAMASRSGWPLVVWTISIVGLSLTGLLWFIFSPVERLRRACSFSTYTVDFRFRKD
jgi:hypothetical protein